MNLTKPDMYQMLKIIEEWKTKFHSDKSEIVFQNKKFYSNVRFNQNSLEKISKNSKGFENLPKTIETPSEIWSNEVTRNYINFGGSYSYVVQTKGGIIENAFLTTSPNKYRTGICLI